MFFRLLYHLIGAGVLLLGLAACEAGSSSSSTSVPEGWFSEGVTKWWAPETDTIRAFRDLETFRAMGITMDAKTASMPLLKRRMVNALRDRFKPLYRNQPEVVDSLFRAIVVDQVAKAPMPSEAEFSQLLERYVRGNRRSIYQRFREPNTRLQLGRDVKIGYPDSLRKAGIGGSVNMQVYLDQHGVPQAIQLLDGPHPTLNALAMHATSKMRWSPTYVVRDSISSWVRFKVNFNAPR